MIFASSLNTSAHREVDGCRSNHRSSKSSFHWTVFSPNLSHFHPSLFISLGLLVSITGSVFSGPWNSWWASLVVVSIIYCFLSCGSRAPRWKPPGEPLCLFPNLSHSPLIFQMWFWLVCTRVRKSHIHLAHPAAKKCPILRNSSCHTQDLTRTQAVSYDSDKPSFRRPVMDKVCKVKQSMVLSSRTLPTAG